MRKIVAVLILFIGVNSVFGQNFNLFNRKDDLKNFSAKTTYVVIQGNNSLEDIVLMDAVKQHWHLSPYEFCNMEEFENIKRDTNFFFLMKVDGQFSKEKEPAMEFLTLVKGSENSSEGLNNMYEVLSLPYKPLNDDSGEEFIYTAPFINIIQAHILKVQRNKLSAYIGISAYSDGMNGAEDKEILFAEDDFGFEVTQEMLDEDFKGKAKLVTKEEIEKAIEERRPNTLVCAVVAPSINQRGSFCFKMLISADTWELYLYRKHKMSAKQGAGLQKEDYRRISAPYAF
jgi:hypothetical protein